MTTLTAADGRSFDAYEVKPDGAVAGMNVSASSHPASAAVALERTVEFFRRHGIG